MKNKYLLTALAVVGFSVAAQATTITWNFLEDGTGPLGTSATFTESGYTLTAYGFASPSTPTDLYAKNESSTESGLGIASDGTEHEITASTYVQLLIPTTPIVNLSLVLFGSVQSGETANIYFSSTLGSLGSLIGSETSDSTFDISAYTSGYIGVIATGVQGYVDPNVLIASVTGTVPTSTVPDGGTTVVLLGGALMGLGLLKRKFLA